MSTQVSDSRSPSPPPSTSFSRTGRPISPSEAREKPFGSIDAPVASTTTGPAHHDKEKSEEGSYEPTLDEKHVIDLPEFPDGGLEAWSVVVGTVFLIISSFGYGNSWGIYQDHYATNNLKNSSASAIGWIGSVQYALILFPSLLSGRLLDLGYLKAPVGAASAGVVLAVFLTAECKEYWQFLLCQGFLLGLCAGFLFGPAFAVTAQWFHKRRALAYSIVATGASLGGVIFPLMTRKLLAEVGFKWTMRITGFLLIFLLGVANLLVKRRLPPKNVKGGLFNFALLKNPAFTLYALGGLMLFLGGYTILFFADVAAEESGLDHDLAQSLVAISNGASFFGRIGAGYLAAHIGPFNILFPGMLLAALTQIVWPYIIHHTAGTIVIVVLYGIANGVVIGVIAYPMSHPAYGELADIGRRNGFLFLICSAGAIGGSPIAGAIRTNSGGFEAVGWWSGAISLMSALLFLASRRAAIGKWITGY